MNKSLLCNITNSEFSKSIRDDSIVFENKATIGICVSGGPDSLALTILMNNWVKEKNYSLVILHFNHKLRKSSDKEVKLVERLANNLCIKFKSFNWLGEKPNSAVMKTARDIRYKTFFKYCKKNNIIHLMTAHHLDDLIETYFMRLQRNFSTIGLSSIPKKFNNKNLVIYRPLLRFKKKRLIATCKYSNIEWITDKSNEDTRFERVRVRNYLHTNDQISKRLEKDIKEQINKNIKLENEIGKFFLKNLRILEFGVFELNYEKFKMININLKVEILKKILVTCSGRIYPPRLKSLKILIKKIFNLKISNNTLHGCMIKKIKTNIIFFKEFKNIKKNHTDVFISAGENFHWDNRFRIYSKKKIFCKIINDDKWLSLKSDYQKLKDTKGIAYDVLKTLPLIRLEEERIIPFLLPKEYLKRKGIELYFETLIPLSKNNF